MERKFGLIGNKLGHSFSGEYFEKKFVDENILDCSYSLFELSSISQLDKLLEDESICGLNVTIPYKKEVIGYLDEIDSVAKEVGAVNTIKIQDGKSIGYNSDVFGFETSLQNFLDGAHIDSALILGSGGAAKAVSYVLDKMAIEYKVVSSSDNGDISYNDLPGWLPERKLIIDTTPLGMFPNLESCPDINYQEITRAHFCFDLIYNPEKTQFLEKAERQGAKIKNGYEMLINQAEKSWEIWNN